jgi:signal transduction histidine kinase
MLAHDLNGGLAAVLASLSQLDGAAGLGEAAAAALDAAVRSLRRMSGLVANFVDIARFEDAAVKPQVSSNNLRALLHEVVEVHAGRAAQFEIDCDPALAGRFDLALIERVLHNLVGNAIRHCTAGGAVRLSARRWDPLAPWSVELGVWNSGPAVPATLSDHLFEQPAQDGTGKPGRGLYFCRLACAAHGGTIAYAPTSGGPTFSVRLPGRA